MSQPIVGKNKKNDVLPSTAATHINVLKFNHWALLDV